MATILKPTQREFKEEPNRIERFRLLTDVSRMKNGINPQYLNFDVRQLNPDQYSAPYHSHRYAEELFVILSGSATMRTPAGLEVVVAEDVIFFEVGETGAHQLYNHTAKPCVYLDVRSYIGFDVCDYPDTNKMFIAPTYEIFKQDAQADYFEGEEHIREKWAHLLNHI